MVRLDVGGRESDLSAKARAFDDGAGDGVVAVEIPGNKLEVTLQHQLPDKRTAD